MANILFVSLYCRNAYGQRLMSANLKRHGHTCHMIFLKRYNVSPETSFEVEPGEHAWVGINSRGREFKYAAGTPISSLELELLREAIEDIRPDLIGLTVNTPLRLQSIQVTNFIKGFSKAPVVWGGFDPTVNPAECLEHCDYACIGEGDITILELAECIDRGQPFDQVHNLACKRNGQPVFNRRAPLIHDLDSLPWRDNEPENKYLIDDNRIDRNHSGIADRRAGSYQTMTARGCPYNCTYCCEATLKNLYAGEKFLRRRSLSNFIAELADAKARFDLHEVLFEDEIFAMDFKWLSEFGREYIAKVDLPFEAYVYPTRNIERILPVLKVAGMKCCCLALESGSARINRTVFGRVYDRDLFLKTVDLCRELRIDFYSDVITYNPYEEESDLKDTLSVLLDMRCKFTVCVNRLSVFPGTHLAQQMARDGVSLGDHSRDLLFNYCSRLFWLASFSPNSHWVIWIVEKLRIFRWRPQWLSMGILEWVLCGPIGKAVDAIVESRKPKPKPNVPPKPLSHRLRRLLEPPTPLLMNPAEPKHFRTGRFNLYMGGAGRFIGGFVNLDLVPVLGVDVVAHPAQLPFRSGVFQALECDGVIQRVPRPALLLAEIERVLRPGGYAHIVAPFCHPFAESQADYGRFTPEGLKQMAGSLNVIAEGWRTGPTGTLLVFFIEYVKLLLPWRWWRALAHGLLGWLLFPLRYFDRLLFRSPYLNRIGNHCYVWLRKPYLR